MADDINLTLVEETPPPRRRGASKASKYQEHLDKLKEMPNKWFRILEDEPKKVTTAMAYCRKHFTEQGFEFSARKVGENLSQMYAIFGSGQPKPPRARKPKAKEE